MICSQIGCEGEVTVLTEEGNGLCFTHEREYLDRYPGAHVEETLIWIGTIDQAVEYLMGFGYYPGEGGPN